MISIEDKLKRSVYQKYLVALLASQTYADSLEFVDDLFELVITSSEKKSEEYVEIKQQIKDAIACERLCVSRLVEPVENCMTADALAEVITDVLLTFDTEAKELWCAYCESKGKYYWNMEE